MGYLPERAYRRQCGWSRKLRVERHTLDWESRKRNDVRLVKKEKERRQKKSNTFGGDGDERKGASARKHGGNKFNKRNLVWFDTLLSSTPQRRLCS